MLFGVDAVSPTLPIGRQMSARDIATLPGAALLRPPGVTNPTGVSQPYPISQPSSTRSSSSATPRRVVDGTRASYSRSPGAGS